MSRISFLFPGQGSQYIGMGKTLCEKYRIADNVFAEASDVLGYDMKAVCFNGTMENLTLTYNAQPAILTTSVAMYQVLKEETGIKPEIAAGHSLGELSALCCGGVLTFCDAVKLAGKRGTYMHEAALQNPGTMLAIMGIDRKTIEELCIKVSDDQSLVVPANYNSNNQIIVSGHNQAITKIMKEVEKRSGKATLLKVSGAFHSPLMNQVIDRLEEDISHIVFHDPEFDIMSNVTAKLYTSDYKNALLQQLVKPVRWIEILEYIEKRGIDAYVDIGPKNVLQKLISSKTFSVSADSENVFEDLDRLVNGKLSETAQEYSEVVLFGREDNSYTEIERKIADVYNEILGLEEVNIHESFYDVGGDSISMMKIVSKMKEVYGLNISLSVFSDNLTIYNIASCIDENKENVPVNVYQTQFVTSETRNEPFDITAVQMAYFAGRNSDLPLGGVGTHVYLEFETGLDIERLNQSLQKLINRHPVLHSIFTEDGKQKILDIMPEYSISVDDISSKTEEEKNSIIMDERKRLSHRVLDPKEFPLFGFRAIKLNDKYHYLFVDFDMLIADGSSLQIIGQELLHYYYNPEIPDDEISFTFRDYMLAYNAFKDTPTYIKDKEYWLDKIDDFPMAPNLPLSQGPDKIEVPSFKRQVKTIEASIWDRIKEKSKENHISPSALLCTAYARVLAYWSNQQQLAINMTVFNRFPFHKDVDKIVGDFTSIVLLGIDVEESQSFWENAKAMQRTMLKALDHRHYDGIDFIRELARSRSTPNSITMPIIFTSMLHSDNSLDGLMSLGDLKYSLSQTPQVILDNQVIEVNNDLMISWDYVEQLFEPEVIEMMFGQYIGVILSVLDEQPVYEFVPPVSTVSQYETYNDTAREFHIETLQSLFMKSVKRFPENIAVELDEDTLTYEMLNRKSNQIANYLLDKGVKENAYVAVMAVRCPATIVNILGVLKAGAVYVPIEPDYPQERLNYIIDKSHCDIILDSDSYEKLEIENYSEEDILKGNIEDVAYTIFTSGSTGLPKGVVIKHSSAVNTILDINERFGITDADRILGISSMCFDLSVYDIFGALSCGATLVMINDQKDINLLFDAVYEKKITVWNSVPAIMKMLIDNIELQAAVIENNSLSAGIFNNKLELQDDLLYWSPLCNWKISKGVLYIRDNEYQEEAASLFPELYFLTQDGIAEEELKKIFSHVSEQKIDALIQEFIDNSVLIRKMLEPGEIFKTQEKLFINRYVEEVAFQADIMEQFKQYQQDRNMVAEGNYPKIQLNNEANLPQIIHQRKSHREFDRSREIGFNVFSELLAAFKQNKVDGKRKYNYASAGALYPIDVYIYVKEGAVENIERGLYYYNPAKNMLYMVNSQPDITDRAQYFTNKDIFNDSAFTVYFIYNAETNIPKYGTNGYFYAILDTGVMAATVNYIAENLGIGMCSIGDMIFHNIEDQFGLNDNQIFIHAIEGGIKHE